MWALLSCPATNLLWNSYSTFSICFYVNDSDLYHQKFYQIAKEIFYGILIVHPPSNCFYVKDSDSISVVWPYLLFGSVNFVASVAFGSLKLITKPRHISVC